MGAASGSRGAWAWHQHACMPPHAHATLARLSLRAPIGSLHPAARHYNVDAWEGRAYAYGVEALRDMGLPVDGLKFDASLIIRGCAGRACARGPQPCVPPAAPGQPCDAGRTQPLLAQSLLDGGLPHPRPLLHAPCPSLILDKELGTLLKVDRFGLVKRAMHGTRMLKWSEIRSAYGREVRGALPAASLPAALPRLPWAAACAQARAGSQMLWWRASAAKLQPLDRSSRCGPVPPGGQPAA